MVPFSFAGQDFLGIPQGALFWPARRALLVADLHLEKASWFAHRGQLLPPYDSLATLSDLEALIVATAAEEVWCLGDSFHDTDGVLRLAEDARAALCGLTARTRWTWISGNHDSAFIDDCGGAVVEEVVVDGIVLRHQADPAETRPEMSGHFHPKLRVGGRGAYVSRRCFVASETKLIFPAFGALTGGLDVAHPEIIRAVGQGAAALVPLENRLLRFPIAV